MRYCQVAISLFLASMLSACFSGPPPKLYLLEPQVNADAAGVDAAGVDAARVIKTLGISAVELPGYAGDERIASRDAGGLVSIDDQHRWAEDPEVAITRLLSARLRYHAGGTVLIEPWPRDYKPVARVEVVFDRLLREPSGGVDMAGQIQLLSGDGRKLLKSLPFEVVHYGRSTGQAVFFAATAQGIDDIARMALDALRVLRQKS